MSKKTHGSLGDRMKEYESVPKRALMRRTPIVIRIDGKAFHTFTRGCNKPFDEKLSTAMALTTAALVQNVQNCVLGYTQSDEISLLLVDYKSIDTDAWYGNNVSKIESVAASLATGYFNNYYMLVTGQNKKIAFFDARSFNIPKDEVCNYFIWRQQDCRRNSISMTAQANFSHRQLHGVNTKDMVGMLKDQKNLDWEVDVEQRYRYGIAAYRDASGAITPDYEIPVFSKDRDFIDMWTYPQSDNVISSTQFKVASKS